MRKSESDYVSLLSHEQVVALLEESLAIILNFSLVIFLMKIKKQIEVFKSLSLPLCCLCRASSESLFHSLHDTVTSGLDPPAINWVKYVHITKQARAG